MNSDIIHLLKQKEKSMKKYHEMKSHENKQLFTEIKNKCTLEIRKAKSKHYHSLIVGAASNPKNTWTALNAVTRGTREKSNVKYVSSWTDNYKQSHKKWHVLLIIFRLSKNWQMNLKQ